MQQYSRKWIGLGILLGVLTGVVVMVVSYVADQVAGLIFPPFSLSDFMARILSGAAVTFTIDLMVNIVSGLSLGSTSETAKLAEQAIAIVQFVVLGGAFGAILGALPQDRYSARLPALGLGLGLLLAAAFAGIQAFLGFSTLQLIAGMVWLATLFGAWGLALGAMLRGIYRARSEAPQTGLSRRQALYLGGSALAAAIAGAVGLGFLFTSREPGQESIAPPTPSSEQTIGPAASPPQELLAERIRPAPGTRPEITPTGDFYRIDLSTRTPAIDGVSWQLEIDGLVDRPATLLLEDIRARPSVSQYTTLSCISNRIDGDLIGTALWTGVRLKDLLDELGLQSQARALQIEAADGFYETVVMEDIADERTLLVYEMNGQPLPYEHGFPLRIYIPNRYGMKQPKWIVRMEAVAGEPPGYWVERGWSKMAIMRTTSAIDEVTVDTPGYGSTLMGGIAHAGERGISRVEVQVDEEAWHEAELRKPPLSPLTWIQWRFEATFQDGQHVARVRAYDGDGDLQVLGQSSPHPNGATGVDTVSFRV